MIFLKLLSLTFSAIVMMFIPDAYGMETGDTTSPSLTLKRKFCEIDRDCKESEINRFQENEFSKKKKRGYQYQDICLIPILPENSLSVFNEIQTKIHLSYQEDWSTYNNVLNKISYQTPHVYGLYVITHNLSEERLGILYLTPTREKNLIDEEPSHILIESSIEIFSHHQRKGYASKALKALTTAFLPTVEAKNFTYYADGVMFQRRIIGFHADIHWENIASLGVHLKNNYIVVRTTDKYDLAYLPKITQRQLSFINEAVPDDLKIAFKEVISPDKKMSAAAIQYLKYYKTYQELEDSAIIEDLIIDGTERDLNDFYQRLELRKVEPLIQPMNGTLFAELAWDYLSNNVLRLFSEISDSRNNLLADDAAEKEDIEALNLFIYCLEKVSCKLRDKMTSNNIIKLIEICESL